MKNNMGTMETTETTTEIINPRKRLRIGRAQKRYKSTFLLLKNIKTESLLWISLVSLIAIDVVILLTMLLNFFNTDEDTLYQEVSNTGTQSSNDMMLSNILLIPIIFISARVLYNIIISVLLQWGAKWHKNILNHLTTLINAIISAFYLAVTSYVMLKINIILFNFLTIIWETHKYVFGDDTGTLKTKTVLLLVDLNMAALYLIFLSIIICLIVNFLRSVICFVNSFDLLSRAHKINTELKIVSYHPSDEPYIKNMYINSFTRSDSRLTEKDFDQFLKAYGSNNFRILLKNGIPIGMYTIGDQKTTLKEMFITPEYRNQGLGEILLNDFEKSTSEFSKKPLTLTALFSAEDRKTAEYLSNRGWIETGQPGMSQKTFQKTIHR